MKWSAISSRKLISTQAKQNKSVRSYQRHLIQAIRVVFPDYKVIINARKRTGIESTATRSDLELDVWIPALKLAFEFQDPHHYGTAGYAPRPHEDTKQNDEMKIKAMEDRGETLIAIPFWWDGQIDSLIETIRERRPELVKDYEVQEDPIPAEPPDGSIQAIVIPGVGELMQATFALPSTDFTDIWWMGEKYDGIRAVWTPKTKTLFSRHGKRIHFPSSFQSHLPNSFLDGELWVGRRNYKNIQSIIERQDEVPWKYLRFLIFDLPDPLSHASPLESRFSSLLHSLPQNHPYLIVVGMQQFTGSRPLRSATRLILDSGGEGTVARKKKSVYLNGRSENFLKLKASRDLEGLVINELGDSTFEISLPNDETVTAKLALSWETTMPKTGDVVTLAYERIRSTGDLVTPKIVRVRRDVEWEDVLKIGGSSKSMANKLAYSSLKAQVNSTVKPRGHWTIDGSKNVREFFDNYAKQHNKDPSDPKTWYSIKLKDIQSMPSGGSMLKHYGGSVVKALIDIYPSLRLSPQDFDHLIHKYWQKHEHRKQLFDEIAKKFKFDPLVASNWYPVPVSAFVDEKRATSVLSYYNGSKQKAIADIYPDIGIDIFNFPKVGKKFWRTAANRKKFFDSFAKRRNFDPLVESNWHSYALSTLRKEKGGISVMLRYYKKDLVRGLKDVYPTMQIDESLFKVNLENHYHVAANRKKFFEEFAHSRGFDPLNHKKWRRYSEKDILAEKAGEYVLGRYKGSLANALEVLFPRQTLMKDISNENSSVINLPTT